MTHQQILDKIADKSLAISIDEDLARLTGDAMTYYEQREDRITYILPKLFLRWNCVLEADNNKISDLYKQKTILAIAVCLHKYGFSDNDIILKALDSIDKLNDATALSDDFFRKSKEIKQFLNSTPTILKRRPLVPNNITFYRAEDVISIQLNKKYYAAYIHYLYRPNEIPIIEFYDAVFDKVPTMAELENVPAKGEIGNDGIEELMRFFVPGIKFLPDLANQIKLVSACIKEPPSISHLKSEYDPNHFSRGSDIFKIQKDIKKLFGDDR